MGTSGPPPSTTLADTLAVFHRLDEPGTPLTSTEVAENLACTRRTAFGKLEALAEQGELRSKKTGARSRIWWQPTPATDADERDNSQTTPGQFSAFVQAVQDYAIFTLDPDGTIASWNEGAEQIKGYEEDEVLGEHISVFYTDDAIDRGVPEQNLEDAASCGRLEDEGWRIRIDGSQFWANVVLTAIWDDDGTLQGFTKVTRDMTERHEHEKERTAIIERMTDAFYALDDEWRFTYVNEQAEEIIQRTEEEVLGRPIWELYPEAEETAVWDEYHEAMETNEPTSFELYYEPLDVWAEINAYPGEEGLSVFFRDITERIERERALEESERRYRTLAEQFPNGSVNLFDDDLRFTLVAGQAFDELGLSPETIEGQTLREAYGEDIADAVEPAYRAALDGEEESVEVEYADREWVLHTVPLSDDRGEVFAGMAMAQNITERKEHERELEQYKTAVAVASDVFVTIDERSTIQAVNPAVEEVFGYDPDELVGEPLTTLMPERMRGRHHDGIRRYLETDERNIDWAQIELPGQHTDGHVIPLAISFSEYEHDGERSFVGVIRDDTERKAHERELETRIQQQQVVTDLGQRALENPDLDVLFDEAVEAVADTLDNAYCKVLDLLPDDDELLLRAGVGWTEGYVGEAAVGTGIDSQAGYTLQSETPIVVEDLRTEERFSGPPLLTEHDVVSGISTIIGPYHDPWGVLGTHDTNRREFSEHDVNFVQSVANILASAIENERVQSELEEREQHLSALIETTPECIKTVAADGTLLHMNPTGLDMVQADVASDVLGECVYDLIAPEHREKFREFNERICRGERGILEFDIIGLEGKRRHMETHAAPLRTPDGAITQLALTRDVTERRVREEKLEELVDKLAESNERLERFAYVASHDLQEPLRMVSSYLQLLERRYADKLDDDAQEFIDFAVDGADRMKAMIEDLLDYSRLDTQGKEFEPTDCNAVLEQTLESLRLSVEETDAEITADTLPTVMGDPDQLGQLFQNLVSNALKYRGDEPPRIAIEVDRRGDEWQFSVTDNGIGIDPGQTDRIFQIFNRLHSTDEYSGTGIGLAMCQKIVERHGGDIWVDSEPGDGSTFSFTLPVAQTTTDDDTHTDYDG